MLRFCAIVHGGEALLQQTSLNRVFILVKEKYKGQYISFGIYFSKSWRNMLILHRLIPSWVDIIILVYYIYVVYYVPLINNIINVYLFYVP